MATPSEIEETTLEELRAMRIQMNRARWLIELEDDDVETRTQAALHKINVHHAIVKLENAKLSEIRDKLVENEDDLLAASEGLKKARKNLEQTKAVLEALGTFLGIVARVVKLLI